MCYRYSRAQSLRNRPQHMATNCESGIRRQLTEDETISDDNDDDDDIM